MSGDPSTRGDGTHRTTDRPAWDGPTRRTFLAGVGGGALVAGLGTAVGAVQAATETADGPPAPTNVTNTHPAGRDGLEVRWEGPADPCESALSHYVVTVEGEVVETVPAGVTRAHLLQGLTDSITVGVRAVDDAGRESDEVTILGYGAHVDPFWTLTPSPAADGVPVGERVDVDLVAGGAAYSVPALDRIEASVELSTPCAAAVADVRFPSHVSDGAYEIAADGAAVTVSASDVRLSAADYSETLATVELVGRRVGGTEVTIGDVAIDEDTGDAYPPATRWAPLAVETPAEGPAPPTDLRGGIPTGRSGVVLDWSGPEDPCAAPVVEYVVEREGERVDAVPAGLTRTRITDLEAGGHEFAVRAVDAQGNESEAATVGAAVGVTDVAGALGLYPEREAIAVGESVTADLVTSAADGSVQEVDAFECTVSLSTPCAVEVTDVSYPDAVEATAEPSVAADGSSVTVAAEGIDGVVGEDDAVLASVELTGRNRGGTTFEVTDLAIEGEGSLGSTVWTSLTVEQTGSELPAVGESEAPPADLDDDGLYEDVNGNGRADYDDAVTLFQHRDSDAVTDHVDAYDFNENDRIDVDDAVELFRAGLDD